VIPAPGLRCVLVAITPRYRRDVELRQLAAFVAVADELHFGRAAERLDIVQPAVSQLVRRLERELDIVLFERSSHHVALTGEGAELLAAARKALAARDELTSRAAALVRGEQGELRIGTSEGISQSLNLLLARFAEQRPNAGTRLQALHTPAKLKALRAGELDVAFVRAPIELSGLRTVRLWSESVVAVLPERHLLAAREEIPLDELGALPLMLGVEDEGLTVPDREADDEAPCPAELEAMLAADPGLRDAWEGLTPGRRRGWLLHFNAAKQSRTRVARIERATPRILEGFGMHDHA